MTGTKKSSLAAVALAVAVAAALAVTACGQQRPAGPASASVTSAGNSAPATTGHEGRIAPVSVSFASPSDGWLLAVPPCARQAHPCRTLLLRRTTDGGRSWAPATPPPAPYAGLSAHPADAVGQILFTSRRDGWAYGPGLWRTVNGGASWRRVGFSGGQVLGVAAAGSRLLVLAGRCSSAGSAAGSATGSAACRFTVYSSPARPGAWHRVQVASGRYAGAAVLTASGGTGYVLATLRLGPPLLLAGPADGSARWRQAREPCGGSWSTAFAAAGRRLFLGCGSEPGAGTQSKTAYVSANGGLNWHRVANPPIGGYLGAASMTPGGLILLSGGRMDVYISRDFGRSWHTSPSLAAAASLAGAGFSLVASATGDATGYAFQESVYRHQFWLTSDGGRHWTAVTVR